MTDLALIDLDQPQLSYSGAPAAVLAPLGKASASVAASVSSLQSGLTGINAQATDIADARAVRRSFAESRAFVAVNPALTAKGARLGRVAFLVLRARLAGKPVALVGVSAFGLSTRRSRFLTRFIVKHSDLVLVRDEASADALMEAGIEPPFRMGADPAWAQLDELYAAKDRSDQVVVAVDGSDAVDLLDLENRLTYSMQTVIDSGVDVVLQPWHEDAKTDNVLLAKKVAARLGGAATVAPTPKSLREARELYSESRAVVATRTHAVMAAAVAGSRTISLASEPGVTRLSDALAVPTLPASSTSAAMSTAVLEALDSDPAPSLAVREHIERAKGSIALVHLLLTEGADTPPAAIDPLPLYPNPWRS